jgi:ABC-type nickel/cobalt efflux system permease component RcnA
MLLLDSRKSRKKGTGNRMREFLEWLECITVAIILYLGLWILFELSAYNY